MGRRRRRKGKRKTGMMNSLSKLVRKLRKKKTLVWVLVVALAVVIATYRLTHAPKPVHPVKHPKHIAKTVPLPLPKPPGVRTPVEKPVPLVRKIERHPKIAFVIDDIGYSIDYKNLLASLGNKVTYAILPQLKFSGTYAKLSEKTGAKVILHLPLEPVSGISPGPGLIKGTMPSEEMLNMLKRDIETVPHIVGVNNHMGSLGTSDRHVMETVLKELKRRNLFFLDSRTSQQTIAPEVARQVHIPFLKRDIFLDNVETEAHVREKIMETAQIAAEQGYAVAIGHYKQITLSVLAEEIPRLEQQGYDIISLPKMLEQTESSN